MMSVTVLLLAAAAVAPLPPSDCGDSEALLRSAKIVSIKDLGKGISGAQKVVLERGHCRLTALFKTVDFPPAGTFHFGLEAAEFSDSYRYEIAAFELDKLLGFGLVAPVVERTIDGKTGSLQLWVSGKLHRFVHDQPPPNRKIVEDLAHVVRLFDYLIFNTDRHIWNFYFTDGWRPLAIDHSIAFHTMTTPSRPLYRFPHDVMERLKDLNRRKLKKALDPYLDKNQIKAFERRWRTVLDLAKDAIKAEGEAEVLFGWKGPFTLGSDSTKTPAS